MPEGIQDPLPHMVSRQRLQMLAVSISGFAFDPQSGQSFTINETGLKTLEHLRDGDGIDETARALALHYPVPQAIIAGSIEVFIRQLGRYLA